MQVQGEGKAVRRKAIMDDLLTLMRFNPHIAQDTDVSALAAAQYASFCDKWAQEKKFLAYFKSEWGDKLGEK